MYMYRKCRYKHSAVGLRLAPDDAQTVQPRVAPHALVHFRLHVIIT